MTIKSRACMHIYLYNIYRAEIQNQQGFLPGVVAYSVEHGPRVWEIVGSNLSRVKPMTYEINTCRFLARCTALLG